MMQLVATIWKPTKANGGCSANMRLDRVGVDCAASVCARYHKGISAHGCNAVIVGGVDDIAEYLKIKEATERGYAEAYEGDGVNFGASGSHTRRGRVNQGGVNTLTTQNEQGVVVAPKEILDGITAENASKTDEELRQQADKDNSRLRIRKLTPKECWRLQAWGFMREDGTWDDTAFEKAKASGTSDSQLYKQAGNGCSANVVEAIGLAILKAEREENNGKG